MESGMKILFLMSHAGAARNFESTLRGLSTRGHSVHLAFDRMEKRNLPGLWDLANSLVDEYPLMTSGEAPTPTDPDSRMSRRMRASLDYMRYLEPEFAEAPKLRARAEKWAPIRVRKRYESSSGLGRRVMRRAIRAAEHRLPVSEIVLDFLREQAPDAVLITPLLEPGSPQAEFLRGAKQLGIPTCLCVHSWDNLTNKGVIHDAPDVITVWNEMQREEAVRLHGMPPDSVVPTGAAVYDHWYRWRPSRSREAFAAEVGIDPEKPFVLYVGSSGFIAPDEAGFIVEWVDGLREQGLDDVQILARPHPGNPLIGAEPSKASLAAMADVVLYPRAGANPTDEQSRNDYFDSIYYSAAVAGVNTSAFLEAGILGRPVITMLSPRYNDTQKGQVHFHHLLNVGGGLLYASETYEEHARDIRRALAIPAPHEHVDERSERFVAEFIRPYGLDEAAAPRMVATVESLPERRLAAPTERVGLTDRALGALVNRAVHMTTERARRKARKLKRAKAAMRMDAPSVTSVRRNSRKLKRAKAAAAEHRVKAREAAVKVEEARAALEGRAVTTKVKKAEARAADVSAVTAGGLTADANGAGTPNDAPAVGKAPKADRPPKAPKADRPAKVPRADRPAKVPRADRPAKEPKAPAADRPPKAARADRPAKAPKVVADGTSEAASPAKPPRLSLVDAAGMVGTSERRPKVPKADRPAKVRKADRPAKVPKADRPPKVPKADRAPKVPKADKPAKTSAAAAPDRPAAAPDRLAKAPPIATTDKPTTATEVAKEDRPPTPGAATDALPEASAPPAADG
jgi:hypothetical protein